jgi:hypothetical protein
MNLIDGKFYVGKDSKNDSNYFGSGIILNEAIKKYGKENFKKEVIDIAVDQEILNLKEEYWISYLNSKYPNGYNIADGGNSGPVMFGEDNPAKRPEVREKLSGENNPAKRPEVRERLRETKQGENNPAKRPEVRIKMSKTGKEVQSRPGVKAKRSIKMKEVMNKPEVKDRCSKSQSSSEVKEKIKIGKLRRNMEQNQIIPEF